MLLESLLHGDNAFVTLTYEQDQLPDPPDVSPAEMAGFIKRLRKRWGKVRYFGCGEYGEHTMRPHYHLAIFGLESCHYGVTRKRVSCCSACDHVKAAWGKGQIMVGSLTPESMAYVGGYINKKMTKVDDPRLKGRKPEFARMSLRPGLGYDMMHEVANTLMEHGLEKRIVDVPVTLRHGGVEYPLGRYLRQQLRTMIGRSKKAPEGALDGYAQELQPLREAAFEASRSLKSVILETTEGRRIQVEARYARNKKVDGL